MCLNFRTMVWLCSTMPGSQIWERACQKSALHPNPQFLMCARLRRESSLRLLVHVASSFSTIIELWANNDKTTVIVQYYNCMYNNLFAAQDGTPRQAGRGVHSNLLNSLCVRACNTNFHFYAMLFNSLRFIMQVAGKNWLWWPKLVHELVDPSWKWSSLNYFKYSVYNTLVSHNLQGRYQKVQ